MIVTGCYAVAPEDIKALNEMDEVDEVVPNHKKISIPALCDDYVAESGVYCETRDDISWFGSHTRAFIKVQDGCDHGCTYCKVRLVRGKSISRDKVDVIREARRLIDGGFRELVLTGICLGSWKGREGEKFRDLVEAVAEIPGDHRIRLSSIEPNYVDVAMADVLSGAEKICKHMHIPLQSGSDSVLARMGRKYNVEDFKNIVEMLRSKMPDVGLTTDIIAGFPGETEMDHSVTMDLLRIIKPSRIHVFKYSGRKGTPAAKMEKKVAIGIQKARVEELIALGRELQESFAKKLMGKSVKVLLEKKDKGEMFSGYTEEYIPVKLRANKASSGDIVEITLRNHHISVV